MIDTPMGYRLHIAIYGRRNVGKSTLINAITNQELSIVSDVPGTTTDPVSKTMELLPIGPVVLIDTAGLDDIGKLGSLRKEKTYNVMEKTDFAIIVVDLSEGLTNFETDIIKELKIRKVPSIVVLNKCDLYNPSNEEVKKIEDQVQIPLIKVSSKTKEGIEDLKNFIAEKAVYDKSQLNIVRDFLNPGDTAVLVTHIDCSAPRGRMILPQQQTIRDVIDSGATAIVTQEKMLDKTISNLQSKPNIVITDSLVSDKVEKILPKDYKLTSFSILIGNQKGDIEKFVDGLARIKNLKEHSRILIVETCTHHRQENDLGKAQIPQYIFNMTGKEMSYTFASGTSFPRNLKDFDAIVHCGGCMINRKQMTSRINCADFYNIPITNYGILITYSQGILKRLLEPFPAALLKAKNL